MFIHIFGGHKHSILFLGLHAKWFVNSISYYIKDINDKDRWVGSHLEGLCFDNIIHLFLRHRKKDIQMRTLVHLI